jgi:hypothetical protein
VEEMAQKPMIPTEIPPPSTSRKLEIELAER